MNLNEYMATEIMGWHKEKLKNSRAVFQWLDTYSMPTGYYATDISDCDYPLWNPCKDLNKAWDCLYMAQNIIGIDVDFSINPIPTKEELALAICEAIRDAKGE